MKTKCKFNVGDKVRVLSNDTGAFRDETNRFEVGDITVVTEVRNGSTVRIGKAWGNNILVSELELVERHEEVRGMIEIGKLIEVIEEEAYDEEELIAYLKGYKQGQEDAE